VADLRAQQKEARIAALRAKRAQEAAAQVAKEKTDKRAASDALKQAKKQRTQTSPPQVTTRCAPPPCRFSTALRLSCQCQVAWVEAAVDGAGTAPAATA